MRTKLGNLMIERYHVLVDRKLQGALTVAEGSELSGLKQSFDALEADATNALREERELNRAAFQAEIQAVHSKMEKCGIKLPDAPNHTKTRSARGNQ